jgi:hypothetical protein
MNSSSSRSSLSSQTLSSQTLSSWSSQTQDSSRSSSSSSSSWSSESSNWDTGSHQAKSYLVNSEIRCRNNLFIARCSIDLRWRDAVIVEARGPLVIDIGGIFDGESHGYHSAKRYCPALPPNSPRFYPQPSSSSASSASYGGPPRSEKFLVALIDGYAIQESWHSLKAAQDWAATLEIRAQASMAVLRMLFEQYPDKFDQRTRTV